MGINASQNPNSCEPHAASPGSAYDGNNLIVINQDGLSEVLNLVLASIFQVLASASPLANMEVRVLKKAAGNTGGYVKETGDWVYGEAYAGVYWNLAVVGADPEDYETYDVKSLIEM